MARFDDLEFVITANTSLLRGELAKGTAAVNDFASRTESSFTRANSSLHSLGSTVRSIFTLYGTIRAVRFFENLVAETMRAGKLTEEQAAHVKALTTSYEDLRHALGRFVAQMVAPTDVSAGIVGALAKGVDKATELNKQLDDFLDKYLRNPVLKAIGVKNGFSTGGGFGDLTAEDLQPISSGVPLPRIPTFTPAGPGGFLQNAGQKLTPALEEFIADLEEGQKLTERMATDVEKQVADWHEAQRLFATGGISADVLARIQDSMLQPIDIAEIEKKFQHFKPVLSDAEREAKAFAREFSASFESRGIQALLDGDLRGAVQGLARDFVELIIKLTILQPLAEKLANAINKMKKGGEGDGGGDIINLFKFLPRFASGGRPTGLSLVGEDGPELFVPDVGGRILSNSQTRSALGGTTVVQNFYNQVGLPPQWDAQLAGVATMAASSAYSAVTSRLGGRK
jgi:hypothetical protein